MTTGSAGRRVVVDKNYLFEMQGTQRSRPLYEAIAARCDHLVFARRLAEAPTGKPMSQDAVRSVCRILGEYRLGDRTINKLVSTEPERSVLPPEVRAVANDAERPDDYVLEEAALHGAVVVITGDKRLRRRLFESPVCVQWLREAGITLMTAQEYLASPPPTTPYVK